MLKLLKLIRTSFTSISVRECLRQKIKDSTNELVYAYFTVNSSHMVKEETM